MDAEESEGLFGSFLDANSMHYERHHPVCGEKNIDFRITTSLGTTLCDVKEVRDSKAGQSARIDAYAHIREDLKNLRKKFGRKKPDVPVVLVTMNFSSKFFTAFSVAHAMYGDIGVKFTGKERNEIGHVPRGNASMTKTTNTSLSGIFVFDCGSAGNHTFFSNEFSPIKLPSGYFPGVLELDLMRNSNEQAFRGLSNIMFWEHECV